jgi:hypothetical protein
MEIKEIYHFAPDDFDANGRNSADKTFREVVKDFERDFHQRHPSHFGVFLFANGAGMLLLQYSCGAQSNVSYGMDLIEGEFDPKTNLKIGKHSKYITVYGIDSAYSEAAYVEKDGEDEYKGGAYPLTLLIDDKLRDGVLYLKYLDDSDNFDEMPVPVDVGVEVFMK